MFFTQTSITVGTGVNVHRSADGKVVKNCTTMAQALKYIEENGGHRRFYTMSATASR